MATYEDAKVLDTSYADSAELIVVNQLPIIEEQLAMIKELIDNKTAAAMAMECTEANKKEVKNIRAGLNRERKILEQRYKEALDEVIAPIKAVQEKFKDCISGYDKADKDLKKKIDTIEDAIKERKRLEIQEYFDECASSYGIDFVTLDDLNDVKITLSASVTSLKMKISTQLARISTDLKMIDMQENREEILVEYKKSLNASDAIATVQTRQKNIEKEKRRRLAEQAEWERQHIAEEKVEAAAKSSTPLQPPTVEAPQPDIRSDEDDRVVVVNLNLGRYRATLGKIKKLKQCVIEFIQTEGGFEKL